MSARLQFLRCTRVIARRNPATFRGAFSTATIARQDSKNNSQHDISFHAPPEGTKSALDLLDLHPSKIKTANTEAEREIQKKQEALTHMWWEEVKKLEEELAQKKAEEAAKAKK